MTNTTTIPNRSIKKSVLVDALVSEAYAYWTTKEGVTKFFSEDAIIEQTVGGKYEIYFSLSQPLGLRGSEGAKIIALVPNELISFTWNAPPSLLHHRNHPFFSQVHVHFRRKENQTEVTLINDGYPLDSYYDDIYDYFDRAWQYVMSSFANLFESTL